MEVQDASPPVLAAGMVYQRTIQGQRELVSPSGAIADHERQLLGMLTGFTPLGALLSILSAAPAQDGMMDRLLEQGLAASVVDTRPAWLA